MGDPRREGNLISETLFSKSIFALCLQFIPGSRIYGNPNSAKLTKLLLRCNADSILQESNSRLRRRGSRQVCGCRQTSQWLNDYLTMIKLCFSDKEWLDRQIVPLRDSLDLQMGADWRWGARCSYTSVKPASRLLPNWTQWSA